MAVNESYRRALLTSRQQHIGVTDRTQKIIAGIYQRAARDLADQAREARDGSLTQRWREEYAAALKDRSREMRGELRDVILTGARESAELPGRANTDWLNEVMRRSGVTNDRFASVLASTPDRALSAIVDGRLYHNGRGLSDRIWTAVGRLEGGIEEIIQQGIAQHMSAFELARRLEQYVDPDERIPMDWREVYPDIPFPLHVDYHAQRLARTSINHAYWLANVESARENPFVSAMHWELSPEHDARQVRPYGPDECDEYAVHDEGLGEGNFALDHVPMPHPLCLCAQWGVVNQTLDEIATELRAWQDGASNDRLDRFFEGLTPAMLGM